MNRKYELKKLYGLEGLSFDDSEKAISCRYIGDDPNHVDNISIESLDWILKALSMQQGHIYFVDAGKLCKGIDEIKQHYLILRLAGI